MKKINWNYKVKVKLTTYGKTIYYHRYDQLIKMGVNLERSLPAVDEDGFSSFQLWDFMELYGPHISMIGESVVEDISFYMNDEDLKDVDERGAYI